MRIYRDATYRGPPPAAARPTGLPPMVIDTREQHPYALPGMSIIRRGLKTGDYSIDGCDAVFAIERKSLADAYGSATSGRGRLARAFERLGKIHKGRPGFGAVVIESSRIDFIAHPPENSRADPKSVYRTYEAWAVKYGVLVHFAGDRQSAERWVISAAYDFWTYHGRDYVQKEAVKALAMRGQRRLGRVV